MLSILILGVTTHLPSYVSIEIGICSYGEQPSFDDVCVTNQRRPVISKQFIASPTLPRLTQLVPPMSSPINCNPSACSVMTNGAYCLIFENAVLEIADLLHPDILGLAKLL